MARCAGVKADGSACQGIVSEGSTYCYGHDPDRAEERRAHAVKGGKTVKAGSAAVRELREELRVIMGRVITGHMDKGIGSVAAQVAGVMVRCLELERRVKETEELERRLEELEALEQEGRSYHDRVHGW